MALIADIFVTIKPGRDVWGTDRLPFTVRSLESLFENTQREQFRLTLCVDGAQLLGEYLKDQKDREEWFGRIIPFMHGAADYLLQSMDNEGLGPTINRAVTHVKSINEWYSHPTHGDATKVAPYLVMCQDDITYTKDWLPVLASRFRAYGLQRKLGFATGHDAVEHPIRETLTEGIYTRDWIRATQMLSTREYWESLMPIPRLDPETGRVRGKPNDGLGSSVDWWLIRNHENSVCKTGRTNLVVKGLVSHIGHSNSTWLKRPLPESDK